MHQVHGDKRMILPKTQTLLSAYKPGTYLNDEVECYDDQEIEELGRTLAGLVYSPSKLRKKLQALGVTLTRSDFYSEVPTILELEGSVSRPNRLVLDHVFRDEKFLSDFLSELSEFSIEFDPAKKSERDDAFSWDDTQFSYSDAMSYYCMIRKLKPQTIVEMGCGGSTLIANSAIERNGYGQIKAIEPYPRPFLSKLRHVELIQMRAQDLDEKAVDELLVDGDIFFIDTTHTVKHDSDCLHIYLRILPHIKHRVCVHVHDIYLPNSLPLRMMRDEQIYWNEQYLLYAYLLGNKDTRVLYGSAYHHLKNKTSLDGFMHGRYPSGGASFWFEQFRSPFG